MKNGLDFFSIPCVASEATELIEAELGYASLAVIIKLLCRIYGQSGYYCLWDNDCAILFARKNGIDKDFADRVVSAALRRGLFNADVYRRHKVLTSAEIQSFFLSVARRRKNVSIDPRYLCYGAGNHGSFPDAAMVEKVVTEEPKGFPLRGSSRIAGDEVASFGVTSHSEAHGCGGQEPFEVETVETADPKGFPLRGSSRVAGDEVSLRGVDPNCSRGVCGGEERAVTAEKAATVGKVDDNNPSVGCDDSVYAGEACGSCFDGWIEPAGAEAFEGILEPEEPFGPTIAPDFDPDTAFGSYFPFNVEMERRKSEKDCALTEATVGTAEPKGFPLRGSSRVAGDEVSLRGVDSHCSRGVCGGAEMAATVEKAVTVGKTDDNDASVGCDDFVCAREACGSCFEGWIEPAGAEAFEGILEPEEPYGSTIAPDFDPDTAFGPYFPFNVEMEGGKPGKGCALTEATVGTAETAETAEPKGFPLRGSSRVAGDEVSLRGVDPNCSRGVCGGAEKVATVETAGKVDDNNPSVGCDDSVYVGEACGSCSEGWIEPAGAEAFEGILEPEEPYGSTIVPDFDPDTAFGPYFPFNVEMERRKSEKDCALTEATVGTAEPKGFPLRGSSRIAGDEVSLRGGDSPYLNGVCGGAETAGMAETVVTVDKAEKKLAFGVFSNVFLTAGERSRLEGLIPDCACYIDRFSRKLREKGYRYADHYAALLDWWASDSALPSVLQLPCIQNGEDGCGEEVKSEADGFFELALARASRRYKASQGGELCQKSGRI